MDSSDLEDQSLACGAQEQSWNCGAVRKNNQASALHFGGSITTCNLTAGERGMQHLQVGGIVRESIVDGPGIRMTVFVQGCSHACPGCHNGHLQPFEGGEEKSVGEIMRMASANPLLDGLTLSGGEPFQQAEGCAALAVAAKMAGLHVMAYSGYTFEELFDGMEDTGVHPGWKALLGALDLLVDGPFILSRRNLLLRFRGSGNQRILNVPASMEAGRGIHDSCEQIGIQNLS
jgi:anaerobic ribonucleoside-triphosphate reductase activating protein